MGTLKLAGCIITDKKGQILLLHRNTEKWVQWEVTGGKIEENEDVKTTAVREVKEELGVDVEIVKKLGDKEFQEKDDVLHYTWFKAEIKKGAPKVMEPQTFDEVGYKSLEEMKLLTISAGAAAFLELVQSDSIKLN